MADRPLYSDKRGYDLMRDPIMNKGSAFTQEERKTFGLNGLLPNHISLIDEQVQRRYYNFCNQKSSLEKYAWLASLQDRNETLYFRLLEEHLEEMLPYIYTPTVAHAALEFSLLYTQSRGVFITPDDKGLISNILDNVNKDRVDVIVVTDGSRVLGIGDVTFGAMTISIGKSNLYVLFGKIAPERILPVVLDLGTDNPKLLQDPLYMGRRHARLKGQDYLEIVDEFVEAVKKRYPKVLLQWEDFSNNHANLLLARYKEKLCTFNDDIQGTSAVVLGAVLGFVKASQIALENQIIFIYGAGSAGTGIADLIALTLMEKGFSEQMACEKIYLVDRHGLVTHETADIHPMHKRFAKLAPAGMNLLDSVKAFKPTILIGTSSQAGHFTSDVVKTMAMHHDHFALFPLSNPTHLAEIQAKDGVIWSGGKAYIATGSPFDPYSHEGVLHRFSQCNNLAIFPAMGIASAYLGVKKITTAMFIKAAETLATFCPAEKESGCKELLPRITDLPKLMPLIAISIAKQAMKESQIPTISEEEMLIQIEKESFKADYRPILRKTDSAAS